MAEYQDKTALIVDDEEEIREFLHTVLVDLGFKVSTAVNGREAYQSLINEQVDLVVSDIKMPEMTGIELFKAAQAEKVKSRFVIMTGFAELKELVEVSSEGVRGFVMKPFKIDDLKKAIKEAMMQVAWAQFDEKAYGSMTIGEFISPAELKYALYIRFPDGRSMKIGSPGDVVPRDKLLGLREKGINEIWLKYEDFALYRSEQTKIAHAVAKKVSIPAENRIKMIKAANELALESMRVMGVTGEVLAESIELMNSTLNILLADDTPSPVVQLLDSNNGANYSHAVCCSVLAGMYAKVLGWTSLKNIEALVMGAFLHDIGMLSLPIELQRKAYTAMTEDERKLYEAHAVEGYKIITKETNLGEEVGLVALHHHENPKGSGFPQGLLKSDIFPMARVVSLIDKYLEVWEQAHTGKVKNKASPVQMLDIIVGKDPMGFDKNDVNVLRVILAESDLKKARIKYESMNRR